MSSNNWRRARSNDHPPHSLAVSGVLGPEEDEDGNPVGLVYFCTLAKGKPPNVVRDEFGKQPHDQLLEFVLDRAFDLIEVSVLPHARKHA